MFVVNKTGHDTESVEKEEAIDYRDPFGGELWCTCTRTSHTHTHAHHTHVGLNTKTGTILNRCIKTQKPDVRFTCIL